MNASRPEDIFDAPGQPPTLHGPTTGAEPEDLEGFVGLEGVESLIGIEDLVASELPVDGPASERLTAVGHSAVVLSLAAAITTAGNLIFHVAFARAAGVDSYGAVVGLLAFGTIASHLQSGIQYSVAREAALDAPVRVLVRDGLIATAPWAVLAGVLALFSPAIADYLRISSSVPVVLALAYAVALVAFGVPAGMFIGRRKVHLFVAFAGLFVSLRFAALFALGWGSHQGGSAVEATFLAMVVTVGLAFLTVTRWSDPSDPMRRTEDGHPSLISDSSFGAFLSAGIWICWSMPVIFARHYLAGSKPGSFGAAQLMVGGMLFLSTPIVSALHPHIVKHRRAGDIWMGFAATVGLSLACTLGATLVGPTFLNAVYSSRYQATAVTFLAFGLSITAVGAATYVLWISQALNSHRVVVAGVVIGALPLCAIIGTTRPTPTALALSPGLALAGSSLLTGLVWLAASSRSATSSTPVIEAAEPDVLPPILSETAVGMMVHNEAASVEQCIDAVLASNDRGHGISRLVVVASGSTDGTEQIVARMADQDPRITLIVEAQRSGKVNAENKFLAVTDEPYLMLVGGDTLLADNSIALLTRALADPTVGMVGGRVVPTNPRHGLANRLAHLVWDLHHEVALHEPKLGEVVAFRRCFDSITVSGADEVSIESEVRLAGYALRYVPDAVIYNHGPTTISAYLSHRARNHRLHQAIKDERGYAASTMKTSNQFAASAGLVRRRPSSVLLVMAAAALEVLVRLKARHETRSMTEPTSWEPIEAAKCHITVPDSQGLRPQPSK